MDKERGREPEKERAGGVPLAGAVILGQTYPSTPSAIMSAPLCSAAMALASGMPTLSRKHRVGSARIELYFS